MIALIFDYNCLLYSCCLGLEMLLLLCALISLSLLLVLDWWLGTCLGLHLIKLEIGIELGKLIGIGIEITGDA